MNIESLEKIYVTCTQDSDNSANYIFHIKGNEPFFVKWEKTTNHHRITSASIMNYLLPSSSFSKIQYLNIAKKYEEIFLLWKDLLPPGVYCKLELSYFGE